MILLFQKLLGALLLMTLLISCTTAPTQAPPLPSPNAAIKAIPCVEVPVIKFHAPTDAAEVGNWLSGALPDPENSLDTPSTVAAIRRANAARAAVCGP